MRKQSGGAKVIPFPVPEKAVKPLTEAEIEDLRIEYTQRFIHDLKPEGDLEQIYARMIADLAWSINRLSSIQNALLSSEPPIADPVKWLNTLSVQSERLNKAFFGGLSTIQRLQKKRGKA